MSLARHIKGLDTLRFVLATWVVFGHTGFWPLIEGIDLSSLPGQVVRAVYNNIVSGPSAVVVFFVISGFCIHYPFRKAHRVDLLSFYARRHIRILVPVLLAVALGNFLEIDFSNLHNFILWSLVCEEIYYTIYPLLLRLRDRIGIDRLVVVAYVLALALAATDPTADRPNDPTRGNYASFYVTGNWLLGLPCWLVGARLAERIDGVLERARTPSRRVLWAWRLGILAASMICSVLRFHSPITYPWSLNFFAFLASFWIEKEILHAERVGVSPLEPLGVFSYSIYLTHLHGNALWKKLGIPFLGHDLEWFARTSFIILVSYVFYLMIERPAHRAARFFHDRLLARRARPALVNATR